MTRLRRQRAAATVVAVVVAVGLALGLPLGVTGLTRADHGVPARDATIHGLPVWAIGSRLVADGSFRTGEQRSSTLTFTRTAGDLSYVDACSPALSQKTDVNIALNGQAIGAGSCTRSRLARGRCSWP